MRGLSVFLHQEPAQPRRKLSCHYSREELAGKLGAVLAAWRGLARVPGSQTPAPDGAEGGKEGEAPGKARDAEAEPDGGDRSAAPSPTATHAAPLDPGGSFSAPDGAHNSPSVAPLSPPTHPVGSARRPHPTPPSSLLRCLSQRSCSGQKSVCPNRANWRLGPLGRTAGRTVGVHGTRSHPELSRQVTWGEGVPRSSPRTGAAAAAGSRAGRAARPPAAS